MTSAFDADILLNGGYRYTTNASWSSRVANERLTRATIEAATPSQRNIIDIGCGDGTYTLEINRLAHPAMIAGVDVSAAAINIANQKARWIPNVSFRPIGLDASPFPYQAYHVAILRGVLHHADNPTRLLQEAMRIADEVVILEPNGWNPILKLIEKFSEYHRQHDEKSFSPLRIASWVRAVGGSVDYVKFVGLVPFFCPNWLARVLKATEPVIERLPVLRRYLCGVCVMRVARGRRCSRL